LEHSLGIRIIESRGVVLVDRKLTGRHYHQYINPQRDIDAGAMEVHGISNESLLDKPVFSAIADDFLAFVSGAELVIHNAPFDIGFLDSEYKLLSASKPRAMASYCTVVDTLTMARKMHPGQRNNLDALCGRYGVDNSQRDLHGALLDAEILADVYLLMTGGQTNLLLAGEEKSDGSSANTIRRLAPDRAPLALITASSEELQQHQLRLDVIDKASGGALVWPR
jgi:DNA polymerase-3 subunit epsilon